MGRHEKNVYANENEDAIRGRCGDAVFLSWTRRKLSRKSSVEMSRLEERENLLWSWRGS